MLAFEAHRGDDAPARILDPGAVLGRLRPVQLDFLVEGALDVAYWTRAVALLRELFPDKVEEADLNECHWYEVLSYTLGLVEKNDWFEVDWRSAETENFMRMDGILHWIYEGWMNSDDEYRHDLAEFLTGIPVRTYGFTEADYENYYGLHVLSGLVRDNHYLSANDRIGLELYDLDFSKDQLRETLNGDRFDYLDDPLCYLGDVGRIAAGVTGNVILDTVRDGYDRWALEFLWSEDVDFLRDAWREAKPMVKRLLNFVEWLDQNEAHVLMMVSLLVDGIEE